MAEQHDTSVRGVVEVAGPEASALLQRLVTNDVERLAAGQACYAALLTPQGKILVDFLLVSAPTDDEADRFLLDCSASLAPELAKRLTLYRLRAKVTISDRSVDLTAAPVADDRASLPGDVIVYRDPRSPALGCRAVGSKGLVADMAIGRERYQERRIAAAVPEGGIDFPYGDTFPHEANLDRLGGVDFAKGCYVGQEVVSRMQHRSSTRKRVTPFVAEDATPAPGTEIRAAELPVGVVGGVAGPRGLALVRLDRVADARTSGVPLLAGGHPIRIEAEMSASRFASAT